MKQFKDPTLSDIMSQIDEGIGQLKDQIENIKDSDGYLFVRTFRDKLTELGLDRDKANRLAADFDLQLSDGALCHDDIVAAAEQYAEWAIEMFDKIEKFGPDDDILSLMYEKADFSLKI